MTSAGLLFYGAWLLSAAAAIVFATTPAPAGLGAVMMSIGFVVSRLLAGPDRLPDPAWVGGLVIVMAGWQLARPGSATFPALVAAGALAGLWSALLGAQGLPWPLDVVVGAALPAATAVLCARRRVFAPEMLREDAQLIVLALAFAVAMAPGILDGWQSALALNVQATEADGASVPVWMWYVVSGAAVLGGVYSFWTRR